MAGMADQETVLRHTDILYNLASDIAEGFNASESADLTDPAVIIFVEEDTIEIRVLERLELIAAVSDAPFFEAPEAKDRKKNHAVMAMVSSEHGTFDYNIPHPMGGAGLVESRPLTIRVLSRASDGLDAGHIHASRPGRDVPARSGRGVRLTASWARGGA
jgi:hypothetical protein